ncbi:MAG TPA: NAD(P) transhydrogenase subunit alpha [Pyrinomonadaceae bacterium]|nr:NAD(P) transhydrogenase subunit alpha [Pyrinomonadaceae bacterium]
MSIRIRANMLIRAWRQHWKNWRAVERNYFMTAETLIPAFYVFALAAFLGYQVISRVPPLLHTPLMSATNAISGISLVGSIVIAGQYGAASRILGFAAVTCATINVVGGFGITDRMLKMFKRKETALEKKGEGEKKS